MGICDGEPVDEALIAALVKEAQQRLGEFSEQELANTACAFATVGQLDTQVVYLPRTAQGRRIF